MITIEKFVEEFKNTNEKENYIKNHIVNDYVSYATKIDECKQIVELASYKELNEQKIYWKNTPAQWFHFVYRLFINYTDIDFGENIVNSYDLLNKENLINIVISLLSKSEYEEWRNILAMCEDDLYENVRSLPSWLETKFDAMKLVFDSMSEALGQISSNEESES